MVKEMFDDVKGLEILSYLIDKSTNSEIIISKDFDSFNVEFYRDLQNRKDDFININNKLVIDINILRNIIKYYDKNIKKVDK